MTATAERQITLQRMATIARLARITHTEKVLVVCHSRALAKQYRHGVKSATGKVGNLHFVHVGQRGQL